MKARRNNYLEKEEQELVEKYRRHQPFSSLLIFALSFILDRDYELIKAKWLKRVCDMRLAPSSLLSLLPPLPPPSSLSCFKTDLFVFSSPIRPPPLL
jgi:hypothetical protein